MQQYNDKSMFVLWFRTEMYFPEILFFFSEAQPARFQLIAETTLMNTLDVMQSENAVGIFWILKNKINWGF